MKLQGSRSPLEIGEAECYILAPAEYVVDDIEGESADARERRREEEPPQRVALGTLLCAKHYALGKTERGVRLGDDQGSLVLVGRFPGSQQPLVDLCRRGVG